MHRLMKAINKDAYFALDLDHLMALRAIMAVADYEATAPAYSIRCTMTEGWTPIHYVIRYVDGSRLVVDWQTVDKVAAELQFDIWQGDISNEFVSDRDANKAMCNAACKYYPGQDGWRER